VNQTTAASELVQSPQTKSSRRRRIAVFALVLICASGIGFLIPSPALPPAVTILPANHSIKPPPPPIPDRWIPPTWGWLWRLRYALLGKPAVIHLKSELVCLGSSSDQRLADALSSHEPLAATNGVRAWILPDGELRALRRRLEGLESYEAIASPQITSGHGVQANLLQTATAPIGGAQVPVGVFFNCLTCAQDKTTVLTAAITHSETVTDSTATVAAAVLGNATRIHTNVTLTAKLQIPPGNGVFLLDTNRVDPRGKHVGIFISSKVQ